MSKFKVGDKVRALANPSDKYYSNEGYFKVGEEFTVKEVFPGQGTVNLVERGQSWNESRFELVEEPVNPNITNFKVGDKVRRKPDSYCFGWVVGDTPCVITRIYDRRDGTQSLTLKDGSDVGWDGFRFELVEEAKPVAPVVPQLPGIPEGFRAVRVDAPSRGEWFITVDGRAEQSKGYESAKCYTILEKIDQPAPVEPAKPEAPAAPVKKVAPKFAVGDKVRLLDNTGYEKFPKGTGAKVRSISPNCVSSEGDLLLFDGALEAANGMFAYRFELVTESPDDLVIQDLVPAREGIDFGWNLLIEEFDKFVPGADFWPIDSDYAGRMHGSVGGRSGRQDMLRLAVMCYRKDLPVLPTTEKVLFTEYVCWDNDGPKSIWWMDADPMVETDDYSAFDHAYPTGNTREVEVPIVKP